MRIASVSPGVRYLIADEISTMLDPITQVELWQVIRKVADRHQLGVLVISHDAALLARLCTRRLHLQGTLNAVHDVRSALNQC